MATINVCDLHPDGSELFSDSESYMMDLTEYELSVQGGGTPAAAAVLIARSSKPCLAGAVAAGGFLAGYIKARFF